MKSLLIEQWRSYQKDMISAPLESCCMRGTDVIFQNWHPLLKKMPHAWGNSREQCNCTIPSIRAPSAPFRIVLFPISKKVTWVCLQRIVCSVKNISLDHKVPSSIHHLKWIWWCIKRWWFKIYIGGTGSCWQHRV